jgi:hypothetical protein
MAALFFVGSFTLSSTDGTGTHVVTPAGLAFTPTAALFFGASVGSDSQGPDAKVFVGAAVSSTDRRAVVFESEDAVGTSNVITAQSATTCIYGTSSGAEDYTADFVSFDATPGFTIDVLNAPTAAADRVIHFILFGGDITGGNTFVQNIGTTAGEKSVTGLAGTPSVVIFFTGLAGLSDTNAIVSTSPASPGLGWMCADGTQGYAATRHNDEVNGSDTARRQRSDRCFGLNSTTAMLIDLNFVSMDANGFTVNQNGTPGAGNIRVYGLALYGGDWTSVAVNSNTTTANFDVTTTGTDPAFALVQTIGSVTDTAIQVHGRRGFGAASSATQRATVAYDDTDDVGAANATIASLNNNDGQLLTSITAGGATPTVNDVYDLSSFGTQKLTLTHPTASGTAIELIVLAAGAITAAGGADVLPQGIQAIGSGVIASTGGGSSGLQSLGEGFIS